MTTTTSLRRPAALLAAAGIALSSAALGTPPSAVAEQTSGERPCFIAQPRWNTALDGPIPTCPTPVARGRAGEAPDVATMADCLDPGRRPIVRTCPYPIKSGDLFSRYLEGTRYGDTLDPGGL